MKNYLSIKVVEAQPLTKASPIACGQNSCGEEGYLIMHKDGSQEWLPKELFERRYSEIDPYYGNKIGVALTVDTGYWSIISPTDNFPGEDLPEGANAALGEAAKNMARTLPLELITPRSQPPYSLSREEVLREKALNIAVLASAGKSDYKITTLAKEYFAFLSEKQ